MHGIRVMVAAMEAITTTVMGDKEKNTRRKIKLYLKIRFFLQIFARYECSCPL